MTAHLGPVPVEELVVALAGAGTSLLGLRAWLHLRLRGRRGTSA